MIKKQFKRKDKAKQIIFWQVTSANKTIEKPKSNFKYLSLQDEKIKANLISINQQIIKNAKLH